MFKALKTRHGKQVLTWVGALTAAVALGVAGTAVVIGQAGPDRDSGGVVGAAVVTNATGQSTLCHTASAQTNDADFVVPAGGPNTGGIVATVTLRKNCQGMVTGIFTADSVINAVGGEILVRAVAQSCTNIGTTPCSAGLLPLIATPGEIQFQDNNGDDDGEAGGYAFLFANLAPGNYVINIVARDGEVAVGNDILRDRTLIVESFGVQTP